MHIATNPFVTTDEVTCSGLRKHNPDRHTVLNSSSPIYYALWEEMNHMGRLEGFKKFFIPTVLSLPPTSRSSSQLFLLLCLSSAITDSNPVKPQAQLKCFH